MYVLDLNSINNRRASKDKKKMHGQFVSSPFVQTSDCESRLPGKRVKKHQFARGFLELLGERTSGWLQRGRDFQKLHLATCYTSSSKHYIYFYLEDEVLSIEN